MALSKSTVLENGKPYTPKSKGTYNNTPRSWAKVQEVLKKSKGKATYGDLVAAVVALDTKAPDKGFVAYMVKMQKLVVVADK